MLTTSAIRRWRLPVLPVRRRDRDWYIDGTRGDFDTSCARLSRVAPLSVGAAVAKFAAAGLVALLVLIVSSGMMLRRSGTREAVNNARSLAGFVTRGIAEPNLTDELINGNQMALARFDRMMRKEALKKPIRRIKLWTTSGRIAYSDEPRLIGSTFTLDADDQHAFATGQSAGISNMAAAENQFEPRDHKLLEVYTLAHTPSGTPVLFETYQSFNSVTASGRRIWSAFLPALIGALVVLELVQLPLAWSMARCLRDRQREREGLLRRAIKASELERRRIAGDLHDGIVQSLAGLSYTLSAATDELDEDIHSAHLRETVSKASAAARQSIRELRSLLVEIYPPTLHEAGLEPALADLLAPLVTKGITARLDMEPGLRLTPETEALLFRFAQETVRNAASHARATTIGVQVRSEPKSVAMTVEDDGIGFDATTVGVKHEQGHFGLRLLSQLAVDNQATLTVDSAPGEGTRIYLVAPAA